MPLIAILGERRSILGRVPLVRDGAGGFLTEKISAGSLALPQNEAQGSFSGPATGKRDKGDARDRHRNGQPGMGQLHTPAYRRLFDHYPDAGSEPLCRGFAIGRSIYGDPARR